MLAKTKCGLDVRFRPDDGTSPLEVLPQVVGPLGRATQTVAGEELGKFLLRRQEDRRAERAAAHSAWLLRLSGRVVSLDAAFLARQMERSSMLNRNRIPEQVHGIARSLLLGLPLFLMSYPVSAQNVRVVEDDDFDTSRGLRISNKTSAVVVSEGPTAFAARTDFSGFDVAFFGCTVSADSRVGG